jgi:hypothetical protein
MIRFIFATLFATLGTLHAPAQESKPITTNQFDKLHGMLKPQPGESRWMEIDWYPSVWEARQKAAAQGKPIFLLAGSGGAPPAGC